MLTQNLGYPRIGGQRELKKACENYWAGKITLKELLTTGKTIRKENWQTQKEAGIDLIPSNDFSYYDQVLDHSLMFGAIPKRYNDVILKKGNEELDLYFAMARGYQKDGLDVVAMEMTKWFDTNYHYIVPEFFKDQQFNLFSTKVIDEFYEARQSGFVTKPVLLGPVSYLLLGKEKEAGFNRLDLINNLLPVYLEILTQLKNLGAGWIQFDEPFLALDLTGKEQEVFKDTYRQLKAAFPFLKFIVATYFERLGDNAKLAAALPIDILHIDLVRAPHQLDEILTMVPEKLGLSLGVIDGRNIWKNDYIRSVSHIKKAIDVLGKDRVVIAPSCSLIHAPADLDFETAIDPEIKNWMAFARQKLTEIKELQLIAEGNNDLLQQNIKAISSRNLSKLIHKQAVKKRTAAIADADAARMSKFPARQKIQRENFKLPLFPTTTIGSFPQTGDIRQLRSKLKMGKISQAEYDTEIEKATIGAIRWQEEIGVDVLVHGEFERNDMVEYFGELLDGFLFTKNGWVQSYGSRCVKPPVIYGDVSRPADMTVRWTSFAQANTAKLMKGMLTGPVTILQWSFVRDDQPRSETTFQIALAIRDEVVALEKAGI
ncbi:MAG: 5-methyltetrahydropteroyltriglutamate--homocysteine S-methyltransferase, partial [Bacteroidota bacterium]|nr:5-methyltetrahydropteroyltriglutamate--homocysteine S-methyltransferase [Bacteroidota bacterium]